VEEQEEEEICERKETALLPFQIPPRLSILPPGRPLQIISGVSVDPVDVQRITCGVLEKKKKLGRVS
jgi:hypothetical protein